MQQYGDDPTSASNVNNQTEWVEERDEPLDKKENRNIWIEKMPEKNVVESRTTPHNNQPTNITKMGPSFVHINNECQAKEWCRVSQRGNKVGQGTDS